MDRSSTNDQSQHTSCVLSEIQEQKLGTRQDMGNQAPSSPAEHIRHGAAGTDRGDTDRCDATHADAGSVPSIQYDTQLLEEYHTQESDGNICGPVPWPLDDSQPVATSEQAHQAPSFTPSSNTHRDNNEISAEVTPLSSNTDSVSSNAAPKHRRPLQISEFLGLEGCIGIIGGSAGLLGAFGFLAFLWFGAGSVPEAANATWVWRQLAMRNWMPRAVTLTLIILPFITGTQATICTSMIAALLLERLALPRSQVARASVMRGINGGPLKLVVLMLSSTGKASFVPWHLEAWLILLVALLTLALQFTSTILLWDMHSSVMIGDPNATTVNSLLAFPGTEEFYLCWGAFMAITPVYPVFGEVSTPHDSSPDNRGFSDTGLKQRGLLPMLGRDNRSSVREYDGMGMLINSRVACMRPMITNASIKIVSSVFTEGISGQLQGVLDYGQGLQEARPGTGSLCSRSEECEKLAFDCFIQAAMKFDSREPWVASGCATDRVGGNTETYQPTWDPAGGPWAENSSVWLVYSTNMGEEEWESLPPSSPMPLSQPLGNSEWTIYEIVPGHFIKISACFSAFKFEYRDIHMKAAGVITERSSPWSLLVVAQKYNMQKVETYLGLDPSRQAIADRGILDLQIKPHDTTGGETTYTPPPPFDDLAGLPADEISPSALTIDSLEAAMNFRLGNGPERNMTFAFCIDCGVNAVMVHLDYMSLFSSVLFGESSGSGRAADALSAMINLAGFNIYDQYLASKLDVTEQVQLVTTLEVVVPGSWPPSTTECAGLIAVASLLAAHLAVVTGITALYVRNTRYSRYGNVWHVISQLAASEELEETLELGNNVSDKAIVAGLWAKKSSKEDVLVKLGKTDGCENIKFRIYGA